jgi:DNA-binding ferritin-like protein
MKPHIGITDKNLKNSIELLSTTLADAMTYTKTKKISLECYWRKFMEMHKLF